jgi:hypothetical protein
MIRYTLVLALIAAPACAGKNKNVETAPNIDEKVERATTPDDKNSELFAERLLSFPATDFRPTDGSGASFTYRTMKFRGKGNAWESDAEMNAGGETIQCQEFGTWTMDPAEDETTAMMTWKMEKTTCAGRPSTADMRVKVTIDEKGNYDIKIR